jgi:tetratricopeptide (TPR) repeat protein
MVRLAILAILLPLASPARAAASQDSFPDVERHLREKNFRDALPAALLATQEHPRSARAFLLLGRTQFYLEHDEEALAALNRSIELDPQAPEAWFFRALLFAYGRKAELALSDFEKATQLDPTQPRYWLELGRHSERFGNSSRARAAFERVVALDPKSAAGWFALGSLASDAGEHAKAAELWEKTLQVDPDYVDAHYNLGQHHQLRGDPKTALIHFLAVFERRPEDAEAAKKVVQAYYRLGDYQQAQIYREKLLALIAHSSDPKVRELKEFCFDQFDAPGGRFFAYERVKKSGDLFYWYTFKFTDPAGRVIRSINLESSAVIRERGVPFILGMDEGATHKNFGIAFKELPAYPVLKELVLKANAGQLTPSATTAPSGP